MRHSPPSRPSVPSSARCSSTSRRKNGFPLVSRVRAVAHASGTSASVTASTSFLTAAASSPAERRAARSSSPAAASRAPRSADAARSTSTSRYAPSTSSRAARREPRHVPQQRHRPGSPSGDRRAPAPSAPARPARAGSARPRRATARAPRTARAPPARAASGRRSRIAGTSGLSGAACSPRSAAQHLGAAVRAYSPSASANGPNGRAASPS